MLDAAVNMHFEVLFFSGTEEIYISIVFAGFYHETGR